MKNLNLCQCLIMMVSLPVLMGATILVDPTKPPDVFYTKPGVRTSMQLTAIFIYPTSQRAIIGGQLVTVGDHLGEFTVTTITPNTVELTGSENVKEVLRLVKSVKQEK